MPKKCLQKKGNFDGKNEKLWRPLRDNGTGFLNEINTEGNMASTLSRYATYILPVNLEI